MTDPDSAEIDALKELEASPGYALVVERIQGEIERHRNELEQTKCDPTRTAIARGQIQALRMVLTIPEILKNEIPRSK